MVTSQPQAHTAQLAPQALVTMAVLTVLVSIMPLLHQEGMALQPPMTQATTTLNPSVLVLIRAT